MLYAEKNFRGICRFRLTWVKLSDIDYIHAETLDSPGSETTRPSTVQLAAGDCARQGTGSPARERGAGEG